MGQSEKKWFPEKSDTVTSWSLCREMAAILPLCLEPLLPPALYLLYHCMLLYEHGCMLLYEHDCRTPVLVFGVNVALLL